MAGPVCHPWATPGRRGIFLSLSPTYRKDDPILPAITPVSTGSDDCADLTVQQDQMWRGRGNTIATCRANAV